MQPTILHTFGVTGIGVSGLVTFFQLVTVTLTGVTCRYEIPHILHHPRPPKPLPNLLVRFIATQMTPYFSYKILNTEDGNGIGQSNRH